MTNFPSNDELEKVRNRLNKGVASKPLPENATAIEKTKYKLCEKFVIYKNKKKITQRAMAEIIGIDESSMSKILHYNFDEFTSDRLIKYLSMIYDEVDLSVMVA